jgi:hypothetical protein
MSHAPPTLISPPSPGIASGRWLATAVIAIVLAGAACETPRDESLAGLVVASSGTIQLTSAAGRPEAVDGPSGDVRRVAASNGRIALETADDQIFVADAPAVGEVRRWRPLILGASTRTPSGIDLSLDGKVLAVVRGDPDTPRLELVTFNIETGETVTQMVDLASNGPPTWFGPDMVVVEVIRPDEHAGIATINPRTGDVTVMDAEGIEPSVTRDGARIAVAGSSGVVVTEPSTWLAGRSPDALAFAPPADSTVLDVALDADGTRLAIAYTVNSAASSSVIILRLVDTVWAATPAIPIPGNTSISIGWLD